jgi:hypothetical protein
MEGLFVEQLASTNLQTPKLLLVCRLLSLISCGRGTLSHSSNILPPLSASPCVSCLGRLSILGGRPVSSLMGISLKGRFSPLSNQEVPPVTSTWFCSAARLSGFPTHGLASARSLVKSGQLGTWLLSINFQTTHLSRSPPTFCATLSGLGTLF